MVNKPDAEYLSAAQVKARYGGVSDSGFTANLSAMDSRNRTPSAPPPATGALPTWIFGKLRCATALSRAATSVRDTAQSARPSDK
jgi:hypothetical protein